MIERQAFPASAPFPRAGAGGRRGLVRTNENLHRGVAQLGRALRSGRRGRRFKSCRPEILRLSSADEAFAEACFPKFNAGGAARASCSRTRVPQPQSLLRGRRAFAGRAARRTRPGDRSPRSMPTASTSREVHAEVRRRSVPAKTALWEGILSRRVYGRSSRWRRSARPRPRDRAVRPLRSPARRRAAASPPISSGGGTRNTALQPSNRSWNTCNMRSSRSSITTATSGLFIAMLLGNVGVADRCRTAHAGRRRA